MKLKDIATIAVLGVIGFALGMGVGMITGMFGALSMYVSAGFAASTTSSSVARSG